MAKVATRINHIAADELYLIRKTLVLLDHDLVQGRNLEVAREAARVHVPLLVRDHDHGRTLDLDPPLDPGPEAFRDQEAARHPDQDQARPKAGQDRGRARVKAAHDQGLTAAREEADRRQDQGQVQEKAIPGRGRQMVQGKACRVQGLDPKAALARARENASREARVDLNRSLSRDLNQDQEAAANRDRVPDQRAVPEAEVRVDRRGKCTFYITLLTNLYMTLLIFSRVSDTLFLSIVLRPRCLGNRYRVAVVAIANKLAALAAVAIMVKKRKRIYACVCIYIYTHIF